MAIEYMGEPLPERTLWPLRPWPMPDELLSSWLNRVATANGMAPRAFYSWLAREVGAAVMVKRHVKFMFGERVQSNETSWVDFRCTGRLTKYLSQRTGMPRRLIEGLALKRPLGAQPGIMTPAGTLQWALVEAVPDVLGPDNDDYPYIRFCPYCLSEWDEPWYRKFWRTSLAKVCTRHACQLLTHCVCGKNVRPHLSDNARSQAFCYSCNQDLRRLDARAAFPHQMIKQRRINRRAYEDAETILRNRGQKWRIKQLIDKPYPSILDLTGRLFPLCKTGLIDAYRPESALSLWMIYHDIRRSSRSFSSFL